MPKRLLRKASIGVAKGFDQVFARTALNPPKVMRRWSPAESLGHDARMQGLATIESFYTRPEFMPRRSALFPEPPPVTPTLRRARTLGFAGEVLDLRWPSAFEPLWSRAAVAERVASLEAQERTALMGGHSVAALLKKLGIDKRGDLREKYLAVENNRFAYARWYRHAGPARPVALLVHGYMSGHYLLEERLWPMRRLFDLGLDVVLPVLPFHGPRRSERRGFLPPAFPSSDPRFTIEGFRQAVFDLQALLGFLLSEGATDVGAMGMSLGGYTSALLSTLDARIGFTVLFIPLAAIDTFAFSHGRMVGSDEQQEAQREALARAQWVVSPFARESLVSSDNVVVIAGEGDQVTGMVHADRLAEHFGAQVEVFAGGHLLHFGKGQAFQPVWAMLGRRGLLESKAKVRR